MNAASEYKKSVMERLESVQPATAIVTTRSVKVQPSSSTTRKKSQRRSPTTTRTPMNQNQNQKQKQPSPDNSARNASSSSSSSSDSEDDSGPSSTEMTPQALEQLISARDSRSIVRSVKRNPLSSSQSAIISETQPPTSTQPVKSSIKSSSSSSSDTTSSDATSSEATSSSSSTETTSSSSSSVDAASLQTELNSRKRTSLSSYVLRKETVFVRTSPVYLMNRKRFIEFINQKFKEFRSLSLQEKQSADYSCDTRGETAVTGTNDNRFKPLIHQEIVQHYINAVTPYRGVLLYHGLGVGKTCSSIIIAEGLKHMRQIIVMTPASLKMNYLKQIKDCGDQMYKQLQHWTFFSCLSEETGKVDPSTCTTIADFLSIPKEYVEKKKGAWVFDVRKPSNYKSLEDEQQKAIDDQLNQMIAVKYTFYHYNGMRLEHLKRMSNNFTENPFDNKVVIIDEVHNLVTSIANKIEDARAKTTMRIRMYNYLKSAQNARIILLSGTPIINYPNELGILYNILRGDIATWRIHIHNARQVAVAQGKQLNNEYFRNIFIENQLVDYIEYDDINSNLLITQNPYGFVTSDIAGQYGVMLNENGNIKPNDFYILIINILQKNGMSVTMQPMDKVRQDYMCLPDKLDEFQNKFFNKETELIENKNTLCRRILGLSSYVGDIKELLPKYDPSSPEYHVVERIPMSEYQLSEYDTIRQVELKQEMKQGKQGSKNMEGLFKNVSSTYRIYSRSWCNFVFPKINGQLGRPMRSFIRDGHTSMSDIDLDFETRNRGTSNEEDSDDHAFDENAVDDAGDADDALNQNNNQLSIASTSASASESKSQVAKMSKTDINKKYDIAVEKALRYLKENASTYLTIESMQNELSPKYYRIWRNLTNEENVGIHLLYSNFLTMEGLGIFGLFIEHNEYVEFKLKRNESNEYVVDKPAGMSDEEYLRRPWYVQYTGKNTPEEKEIMRYACNGEWGLITHKNIVQKLHEKASYLGKEANNHMGDIIKLMMITKAGAEGINLFNVRYVHLMEPYWHMVRFEQVIGRARRICSHKSLPEELRQIKVYVYLMTISAEKEKLLNETIRQYDVSRRGSGKVITTDESLYEIMERKNAINRQLLNVIKETAFDCKIHGVDEGVSCFTHIEKVDRNGNVVPIGPEEMSTHYNYEKERGDKYQNVNIGERKMTLKTIRIPITFLPEQLRNEEMAANSSDTHIRFSYNPSTRKVYSMKTQAEVGQLDTTTGEFVAF